MQERIMPDRKPGANPAVVVPTRFMWQEYERLKQAIQNMDLTPDEYERQIKRIVNELGI